MVPQTEGEPYDVVGMTTRPSMVSQSLDMVGEPIWLLRGEEVPVELLEDALRWGVLAPELKTKERVEETDDDGEKAVFRRRSPVVLKDEGAKGWNREEVRILMY